MKIHHAHINTWDHTLIIRPPALLNVSQPAQWWQTPTNIIFHRNHLASRCFRNTLQTYTGYTHTSIQILNKLILLELHDECIVSLVFFPTPSWLTPSPRLQPRICLPNKVVRKRCVLDQRITGQWGDLQKSCSWWSSSTPNSQSWKINAAQP